MTIGTMPSGVSKSGKNVLSSDRNKSGKSTIKPFTPFFKSSLPLFKKKYTLILKV